MQYLYGIPDLPPLVLSGAESTELAPIGTFYKKMLFLDICNCGTTTLVYNALYLRPSLLFPSDIGTLPKIIQCLVLKTTLCRKYILGAPYAVGK